MVRDMSAPFLLFVFVFKFYSTNAANEYYCRPSRSTSISLNGNNLSYLSSANFPNALNDYYGKKCTVSIQPKQGFGVRLLFEEFFVNPNNVLTITTATGQTFTRFGSEDDPERGTVALYMSPGPMNLTFEQKTPTTTAIKHAGFRTILKPFNLTNDEATQCHENRYLKETYFVTSFAYPQDYGSRRNCSWTFTADDNIRVLFYDFQSCNVTDSFTMTGQGVGSTANSTSLGGTDVTSDLTVVFYYRKFVQINFTSGFESCNTSRRFSFVIDVYADPPETKERCVGDGVLYDMSNKTSVAISTMNYVTKAYTNYLDCRFSFTNPPYSHIIYLNMVFESERCCDTMIVDGIGKDYVFQGQRNPAIYFANSANVSLVFTSDGVRTAAGFQGVVSTLDCGCKNVTVDVEDGKDYWIESPGFGTAPTYCPRLNCFWELRSSRNQTLDITSFSMGLRTGDRLAITDFKGDLIDSLSVASNSASQKFLATISTGYVAFHFTSVHMDYVQLGSGIGGFRIHIKSNPIVYNQSKNIVLTDDNSVLSTIAIISSGEAFLWHVQARKNRTITLYTFGTLRDTGAILDIFDGADTDAPILDKSQFYNSDVLINMTNAIRSSGDSLTFRLIGSSQMFTSYRFFGLLSDIVNDSYALYCKEPFVKGFTNEAIFNIRLPLNASANTNSTTNNNSSASNNSTTSDRIPPNAMCVIVLHGLVDSFELRRGLAFQVLGVSAAVQVYKGTTLSKKALLASTPPYPNFLFGNDVTIAYSAAHPPKTVGVRLTNMLREYTEEPATNETVGYLFSPDFLSDTDLGRIFQRYELSIEGEPMNGFQIEIMRPINNCQILLEGDYDGTPSLYDELLSGTPSRNVCVTNMAVIYRSNGGIGKGMFLKYRKSFSNQQCLSVITKQANSQRSSVVVLQITALITLLFCSI
ncbi:hypothetical protein Tcan_16619 [Toxocara canis]|uniref:Cubilin n=1 Tax=Toxocara canis TaxID=6265 RepID=A0A0B2V3B0_TOXCA|nr:hypothetical protein Tcan_16619 [Toxocara canis]